MDHSPASWRILDGTFVYRLSSLDLNRFSFNIEGGYTDDGTKTSKEELRDLASFIVRACNAHAKLINAVRMAKDLLIKDFDEPGRTVFWACVDALKETEPHDPHL